MLAKHTAVCAGYADLFVALAHAADLNAVTIRAYAKGYGYSIGSRFKGSSDHAWNAVEINGQWYYWTVHGAQDPWMNQYNLFVDMKSTIF